jgi:hypothetical protein
MTQHEKWPDRLMVDENWYVDQLSTLEECSEAEEALLLAIARTEGHIDNPENRHRGEDWLRRARGALRYKRAALQAVRQCRSDLKQAQRNQNNQESMALRRELNARLAAEFCRRHPDEYARCAMVLNGEGQS